MNVINFEVTTQVDNILDFLRLGVLGVNWNTAKIWSRSKDVSYKDDKEVVPKFPCLLGHPVPHKNKEHGLMH